MNKNIIDLNEQNKFQKRIFPNDNFVTLSELKTGYYSNVVRNFSIKFTIMGLEHYKINNKKFEVPAYSFLTVCSPCDSIGYLDSDSIVKALGFDINLNLLNEAFTILSADKNIDLDNNLLGYFKSKNFFTNVYSARHCELGLKLLSISQKLNCEKSNFSFINEEMFYELAELLIRHESDSYKKLNLLNSIKISTKKEILKRLLLGKIFIEDNFSKNISVKDVSKVSCLSEFHFFRSFKEVFSISPHNYLIKIRLNEALKLLKENKHSIGDIAYKCGFTDIHSFSKSFKKLYNTSPSKFFSKN